MKMKARCFTILVSGGILLLAMSCNRGPKVITLKEDSTSSDETTGIFSTEEGQEHIHEQPESNLEEDMHSVVVLEVLPTVRYVYLRVKENEDEFWIATNKMEVSVGKTYFYRGGLLKTDFESKEHQRVFDKMYLVSSIVEANHGNNANAGLSEPSGIASTKEIDVKGSIKIADLVANPKKYDGKTIQISGTCVKVNPNIMGRHWIHLQDGSKNDFDMVITCQVVVPEGHKVTMMGKVALNKDFGSGYKYGILLEEGEVVR